MSAFSLYSTSDTSFFRAYYVFRENALRLLTAQGQGKPIFLLPYDSLPWCIMFWHLRPLRRSRFIFSVCPLEGRLFRGAWEYVREMRDNGIFVRRRILVRGLEVDATFPLELFSCIEQQIQYRAYLSYLPSFPPVLSAFQDASKNVEVPWSVAGKVAQVFRF